MGKELLRLTKSFSVVKFNSTGKGEIFTLPSGAVVEVLCASTVSGCLEILYEAERYNIFEKDLKAYSRREIAVSWASARGIFRYTPDIGLGSISTWPAVLK